MGYLWNSSSPRWDIDDGCVIFSGLLLVILLLIYAYRNAIEW